MNARMRPIMLSIYRRHRKNCPHGRKGRKFYKCSCPVWTEGTLHGKRYGRSLKTTDWQKARRKADRLESPDSTIEKPINEAVEAWFTHLQIADSTRTKYRNVLRALERFCDQSGYSKVGDLTIEVLDDFRSTRKVAPWTSVRDLQVLRQWLAFCFDRKWTDSNPAKQIKPPKNAKPRPVEPYTTDEMASIINACNRIGKHHYERLRARALVLLMRFTGLRITDAILLRRDRIRDGRIMLFTQKTGGHILLPVPKEVQDTLDMLPAPRGDGRDRGYYFWNGIISKRGALGVAERTLQRVFEIAGIPGGHAHRFRHTLATQILTDGGTEQDAADVLGISPSIVHKHYAKWTTQRQERIFRLMERIQRPKTVHPSSRMVQ